MTKLFLLPGGLRQPGRSTPPPERPVFSATNYELRSGFANAVPSVSAGPSGAKQAAEKLVFVLDLGGAALQRCDKGPGLSSGFSRRGTSGTKALRLCGLWRPG